MTESKKKNKAQVAPGLRVIPLGGLGEIGKNMLVLEVEEQMLIIDAGLMFPTSDMHGIDIVIPDAGYVLDRLDKVRGIVLTHGHEDHIGALPFFVESGLRAPVYATALTRGLLEVKLREEKLLGDIVLHTVTSEDVIDLAPFTIEFFHTTHSFPDSVGVAVTTPIGRVIHTSDYRFDPTPADGRPTDMTKLRRWGDEGVLLLLADSTNAEHQGATDSEATVEQMLESVIGSAQGRVLLATFASNSGPRPASDQRGTASRSTSRRYRSQHDQQRQDRDSTWLSGHQPG